MRLAFFFILINAVFDLPGGIPLAWAESGFKAEHLNHVTVEASAPGYKEALYYSMLDTKERTVQCRLCPKKCTVAEGAQGFCRARENRDGKLYSLGYGFPCAVHVDPIEKKPFFQVMPKTLSFSLAAAGCNFRCQNCQNWQISQISPKESQNLKLSPEEIIKLAGEKECRSVAFTYTEPMIFYEYMLDICRLAKKAGLHTVCHSNGSINPEPLRELCPVLDAANIDLKGFNRDFYRNNCGGELDDVLSTLLVLHEQKVWIEITNLVIPGMNDDLELIRKMCEWIRDNLGTDVPLHFSRFYPCYRLTSMTPTPVSTLTKARGIAKKAGLKFVYIGNVPGNEAENTICPKCGKILIKRAGYEILEMNIEEGKCKYCKEKIPGIW
ncbi:MAG: AmmeMemoRadiSam system radical SAM enzyme [Candidatus Wallbacteria bacterium]|nr:AmmeMemoRadiSam system radical SAM enzyme [Candidatus Wallbacteria bacterium]